MTQPIIPRLEDYALLPIPQIMAHAALRASYCAMFDKLKARYIDWNFRHEQNLGDLFEVEWSGEKIARNPDVYSQAMEQYIEGDDVCTQVLGFSLVENGQTVVAHTSLTIDKHAFSVSVIDPDYRHQGLGKVLLARIIACVSAFCPELKAEILETNPDSWSRFERLVAADMASYNPAHRNCAQGEIKERHYLIKTHYPIDDIYAALTAPKPAAPSGPRPASPTKKPAAG